ncbi:MAG: class A beta-lactamase-related serine hydrolase [Sphingobacteriia bacterium]|nr:MAG: class A beta-lactamase-related serine hydrolase [Sphingobacteriia bacterium]
MKLFFFLLAPFFVASVSAQQQKADNFDSYIQHRMKTDSFPGAVLLITKNGKPIKTASYGLANLEQVTSTKPNTVFELASVSKPITATAIMLLVEQGKLSLDSSITAYLSGVPKAYQPITIRQIMSHTAGMPADHYNYYKLMGPTPLRYSVAAQFEDLYKLPMKSTPGTAYLYSNAAFFMQAAIIEKVTGISFSQFVQNNIFKPLGMNNSSYINGDSIIPNRAQGYTKRKGRWVRSSLEAITQSMDANGFGGAMSTVMDYEKFLQATAKQLLLSKESYTKMITPTKLADGNYAISKDGSIIGLGWFLKDFNGRLAFLHGGYSGTFALHFMDEDISVIFFTNLSSGYGAITGDKGFDFMKTGFELAQMAVDKWK